jgi:hypothetical protein
MFEETPHASGLGAGFFFSGRRNQFAAVPIGSARKVLLCPSDPSASILTSAPFPHQEGGAFLCVADVSAAAHRPRRA